MNTCSFFLIFLSFYVFLNFPSQITCNLCNDFISKSSSEKELISQIQKNITELIIEEKSNTETSQCILNLLSSGNYEALEVYLEGLTRNGVKYREKLSKSINQIETNLNMILNKFSFDESDYQKVTPALQWAQSLDSVFLEIKFAHRHDSPGCLEMSDLNINITNSTFELSAYCVLGDVPIKFELNLEMFKGIDDKNSTYESGSVGRYQITFKKEENEYWKQLTKDGVEKTNPNMRMWFEMQAKYEKEIEKFEQENEDQEFLDNYNKLEEEYKKKMEDKKKRKKKKKGKKKNNNKNNSTSKATTKNEEETKKTEL